MPFLTLFERKILRYVQLRKGPNKTSVMGLLQPIADGIKLIVKKPGTTRTSKTYKFYLFPLIRFGLMIVY